MEIKLPELHEELLIQVLLRLPVKSLLRFRCVSKSWLSLISDPHLAKSHFELAAAPTHRILILGGFSLPETRSIDQSLHDDSASSAVKLDCILYATCFHGEIMGSCRGLLLLRNYSRDLFLWNPSNGFYKTLSLSPITSNSWFWTFFYGLGYDPSTDDYLVALASCNQEVDLSTHFEIFSLRTNSWKEIEGSYFPYMNNLTYHIAGTLLHGTIHWLVNYCHDGHLKQVKLIVAFNLIERSFSEILLPVDIDYPMDYYGLWVFEGCLSLCVSDWNRTDIWVMKEYKVQSSWTKSIVVATDDIPTTRFISGICSTKSGDIILRTDGFNFQQLVKCNSKGEVLEHRSYPQGTNACVVYTESLFSFPSRQGQEDNGQEDETTTE